MLLYFPKHFDQNEWFIIIVILLSFILYKLLPKRFPTVITTILVLYSIAMAKIFDHTIAVKPYDLYDLTDSSKYELFDLIMYAVYPPFSYLFIYIYDYFELKGIYFVFYLVCWALISIGVEFIAVQFNVFNYHGWRLIYSLPTYTVIMLVNVLLFNFCIKYFRENYQSRNSKIR